MRFHLRPRHAFILPLALLPLGLAACGKSSEKKEKKAVHGSARAAKDEAVEKLRNSIPGGQVILPDEPAFELGKGWGSTDYHPGDQTKLTMWTLGDQQKLDWAGPADPGEFTISIYFWRQQEFPEKEIKIEYLLPGETDWKSKPSAEKGPFVIEGKVKTTAPFQRMHLEMKIPGWVPAEKIPGSTDPRKIGMTFLRIELTPVGGAMNGKPKAELRDEIEVPDQSDV